MLKLIKKANGTYEGTDGKEYPRFNYYLVADGSRGIAIKPSFKEDYKLLAFLAEVE